MKSIKVICLLLVLVLLLPVCGCSKSQKDKIDPQYYALGKEMLGLSEAYLGGSVTLADAKSRAASIYDRLKALPLLPEEDPLYEETDRVHLYIETMCLSFSLQDSETRTLALQEDLGKYGATLKTILGLGD